PKSARGRSKSRAALRKFCIKSPSRPKSRWICDPHERRRQTSGSVLVRRRRTGAAGGQRSQSCARARRVPRPAPQVRAARVFLGSAQRKLERRELGVQVEELGGHEHMIGFEFSWGLRNVARLAWCCSKDDVDR